MKDISIFRYTTIPRYGKKRTLKIPKKHMELNFLMVSGIGTKIGSTVPENIVPNTKKNIIASAVLGEY